MVRRIGRMGILLCCRFSFCRMTEQGAIGGQMSTAESATDPMFFLHHAYIDAMWYVVDDLATGMELM